MPQGKVVYLAGRRYLLGHFPPALRRVRNGHAKRRPTHSAHPQPLTKGYIIHRQRINLVGQKTLLVVLAGNAQFSTGLAENG